ARWSRAPTGRAWAGVRSTASASPCAPSTSISALSRVSTATTSWRRSRAGGAGRLESLMPRISTQEFDRLPLRVHDFLVGVPLHDVWAVDLPRTRSGITLDEFLRTASASPFTLSPVVRALLNIRLFVGRLFG